MSAGNGINRRRLEQLRTGLEPAERLARHRTGNGRGAAVLMPIFERAGDLHVVFIRRSDRVESHRGQVAFPGGRVDPTDPNLLHTALREAQEEVGIEPATVDVLGGFEGAVARVSEIHVTPFVGVIPHSEGLRPDPKEVADVFDVPLSALADPRYRKTYRFDRGGGVITQHPAIIYANQIIWGLTLRFTEEMLRRMDGAASG